MVQCLLGSEGECVYCLVGTCKEITIADAGRALTGQTCVVTGASRGLGAAIARELAGGGATVIGTYLNSGNAANEIEASTSGGPGSVEMVQCDVTDDAGVEALLDDVSDRHGSVDVLVNNAGIWRGGRLEVLSAEDWRSVIEVDLLALFQVTKSVVELMLAAGGGRIVMISSIVALGGYPGDTAYASAKAGVIGFTRSLAREVARKGIAVNAVAPGFIETDMTAALPASARQKLLDRIPAGRIGDPDEVARLVGWLASAPSYLTGAVIPIAGGM